MGSVWKGLGSEVTVVEFAPDIVPSMDSEMCKQFQFMLEKQEGIHAKDKSGINRHIWVGH